MPRLIPEDPAFDADNGAEKVVWQSLAQTLPDEATLLHGVRITNLEGDREGDLIVLWPGKGIAFIEVKGGDITALSDGTFNQRNRDGKVKIINPVKQAHDTSYVLANEIKRRTSFQHWFTTASMVAMPFTTLPSSYSHPSVERHTFISKAELGTSADFVSRSIEGQMRGHSVALDHDDIERIVSVLEATILDPRDPGALPQFIEARNESVAQRVKENEKLLDFASLLTRFEVRGPAGSGKTALALAQAKRLTLNGERVLFLCYSQALSRVLKHDNEQLPRAERISSINTLHSLAMTWGVRKPEDASQEFWDTLGPQQLKELAQRSGDDQKFDAVIVDESQDFHTHWWETVVALLRNPEQGKVFAFGDTGQGVFGREGTQGLGFVPLVLDTNLRNAQPISEAANFLTTYPAKSLGLVGPQIVYYEVPEDGDVEYSADAVADMMLASYQHEHIAMLMTRSRHEMQRQLMEQGRDDYFKSLWSTDEIFYGTVSGFKGLERNCVILGVNGFHETTTPQEVMYVGTTRARDLLVVVSKRSDLESAMRPEFMQVLDANRQELEDYGNGNANS